MDSWMVSKNYMLFTFGQPKKSKVLNIKIHICIFNLANLFFIVCKFIHLGMTRMGSDCPNALASISGWGSLLTVACVRSGQSWTPGTA